MRYIEHVPIRSRVNLFPLNVESDFVLCMDTDYADELIIIMNTIFHGLLSYYYKIDGHKFAR